MRATTFGQLVKQAAEAKGLSQGRLGYLLTSPDGTFYDSSQVRLIYKDKRRPTHDLIQKLIDTLDPYLDPPEAWAAAGLLPPGVDAQMLRRLDIFAGERHLTAVGADSHVGDIHMRPWVPTLTQRRRHLRVVPRLPERVAS